MSAPLDLSTYRGPDGTWVMTAAGEVDMSNAGQLGDALGFSRGTAQWWST